MSIFHVENGFFGQPKVQEAYNIIFFSFLMENRILKKFGSVDVKITPDICSYGCFGDFVGHVPSLERKNKYFASP